MSEFEDEYASKGVVFLAINAFEDRLRSQAFIDASGMSFTWLFADDASLQALGIGTVPTQIIVDREGKVTWTSGIMTIPKGVQGIRDALDDALRN